uniref:Restriction alleviation protein n=1 Tax=Myoviridae sp. ctj3P51 TaxID=2826687 RepID=A0A8S5NP90_9CAUD|nr:MAG TPA: restriction alleviation protein [Myoviridae sp. ctj3P51]
MDLNKLRIIADKLDPSEIATLSRLVVARYRRQTQNAETLNRAQVLACPKCGRKRTVKVRHGELQEFCKMCGNPNCGFIGYASPTDSKNGGRIVSAWNQAVKDYIAGTYKQPPFDDTWQII